LIPVQAGSRNDNHAKQLSALQVAPLRASLDARHICARMKKPCPLRKNNLHLKVIRPLATSDFLATGLPATEECNYQLYFQQHSSRSP
jgi:hypothetical protein